MVRSKNTLIQSHNLSDVFVVKAISDEAWLLNRLFILIRENSHDLSALKDMPVQFGPEKSKPFSEVVFDFRNQGDAYRLAQKIVAQGGIHREGHWEGFFQTPRLLILPKTSSYNYEDRIAEFRRCAAKGIKGSRVIIPSLRNVSPDTFETMRKQGEQIVAMTECKLTSETPDVFHLTVKAPDQVQNRMALKVMM